MTLNEIMAENIRSMKEEKKYWGKIVARGIRNNDYEDIIMGTRAGVREKYQLEMLYSRAESYLERKIENEY